MDSVECSHEEGRQVRLLVADDHILVAQGIGQLLQPHFPHVRIVDSGEALMSALMSDTYDVVITDVSMSGMSGIEAMQQARQAGCTVPFIFLTMHGGAAISADAIRSGASGYLLKTSAGEELVRAVREVLAGRTYVASDIALRAIHGERQPSVILTDKQQRILEHVARGLRSKQIAYELGLSVRTVESHKYTIMQEFGVHGTVELVRRAEELGLIDPYSRRTSAA
jgi:DNA-binding NarL/FixJ family response regulator